LYSLSLSFFHVGDASQKTQLPESGSDEITKQIKAYLAGQLPAPPPEQQVDPELPVTGAWESESTNVFVST
jgi:hypothetical protein